MEITTIGIDLATHHAGVFSCQLSPDPLSQLSRLIINSQDKHTSTLDQQPSQIFISFVY